MHSEKPNQSATLTFTGKNRRGQQRFALARRMAYRLAGDVKNRGWKQGVVLNMSATGIRFETTNPIPEGTDIDLMIDWPGIYHGRDEVRLYLSGTVCRSGLDGTALRITSHDFRFAPVEIPSRFRRTERKLAVA